ncbi:MAG: type II secretion system F family protein [Candidatus Woesearchaeota archaeon]
MNIQETFQTIGKALIPKRYRPRLRSYIATAGIQTVPYSFFTILFIISISITGFGYFTLNIQGFLADQSLIIMTLSTFFFWFLGALFLSIIVMAGFYFWLNMKVYARTKEIEDNLTDYLVLVSTNLKGGLSFEKSLWASIKPEFGILSEEMNLVSKRVLTGSDLIEALSEFSQKYESPGLKRSMGIIIGELDSGGKVASVLDNIIDNLRKTKVIKDEMSANTLMFTIFISAIVLVISPLLFALAFNLLDILINVSTLLGGVGDSASQAGFGNFSFDEVQVESDHFMIFSVLALIIISLFSSMIISIIQRGDIMSGVRYLPFFAAVSAVLYFIFLRFLTGIFGFL